MTDNETGLVRQDRERRDLTQAQPDILQIHTKLEDPQFLQLLRDVYFRGCDEIEFKFAIETCRHLGLDPIARQIWFIKIWDRELKREVMTPIVSIDGLRSRAERTGKYRGQLPPEWCGQDGVWRDVWLDDGPPSAARVGVLREGFEAPVYGVVTYRSFVRRTKEGKPMALWGTAPDHMLAKCAEANALKKAHPLELGGHFKIQDVDQWEDAGQRSFRVQVEAGDLLRRLEAAKTTDELGRLGQEAAALPDGATKLQAREAWRAARDRILAGAKKLPATKDDKKPEQNDDKPKRKRGRPPKKKTEPEVVVEAKPESAPEPKTEHDYGPPPMEPGDVTEHADPGVDQAAFGFDPETA